MLRYRPPAPMVPQVAMKPFKLTDNYTVSCIANTLPLLMPAHYARHSCAASLTSSSLCLFPLAVSRFPAACNLAQSYPSCKPSILGLGCVVLHRRHATLVAEAALTCCDVLWCAVLLSTAQAPRGAFIIPDIVSACKQGYTDGERFDPERFR